MKIAFAYFPLTKLGGIITGRANLRKGFEELGHEVDEYFISTNTNRLPDKNDYDAKVLGFEKDEWYKDLKETLESYDLVIYYQCCPHKTKAYDKETWKKCYDINTKKMAVIHDLYYNKYYQWFSEIPSKYKVKIFGGQKRFIDSLKGLKAMKRVILNPYKKEDSGLYDEIKENIVVDHNNNKESKGKKTLIDQAKLIPYPIYFFGSQDTVDYYNIYKPHPNFSLIKDMGWGDIKTIAEYLKKAKVFTDLNKSNGTNHFMDYTINEAINYGAVPITVKELCPAHGFQSVVTTRANLYKTIIEVIKNFKNYKDLREFNLKSLEKLEPKVIAKEILEYNEEDYIEEKEGLEAWGL